MTFRLFLFSVPLDSCFSCLCMGVFVFLVIKHTARLAPSASRYTVLFNAFLMLHPNKRLLICFHDTDTKYFGKCEIFQKSYFQGCISFALFFEIQTTFF